MGQNAIKWDIVGLEPYMLIEASLDNWWNAGRDFGVGSGNKYDDPALYNFANMVYSNTTKVGCSYQACNNGLTISCLYNAVGFYDDEPMWETGKACKKDNECTVYPNSKGDDGLCIKGGEI
ncbi:hypothetical protein OESDEN_24316, partial [Oesophagostomum dentatum]